MGGAQDGTMEIWDVMCDQDGIMEIRMGSRDRMEQWRSGMGRGQDGIMHSQAGRMN